MVLKDSSPYTQWRGARPVFVDVGSFEELAEGEPWVGYRQFCMLYLYPLLLEAYRAMPHQPWLRGAIDGITPEQCSRLLSARATCAGRRAHPRPDARPARGPPRRAGRTRSGATCGRRASSAS